MEGSITQVDYQTMSKPELVEAAQQIWDEYGSQLPEQLKEPIEPVFHALMARVDGAPTDETRTF